MILALKTDTIAGYFRQSIDICGRLKPSQRLAVAFLIYVMKSLASDGFAFHCIRVASDVLLLIDYHDVALGGRQISGHIGEKNP